MRIIGGELGGRKIAPPHKMPYTRPTTDIAKEGLFNVLQHRIELEGISKLDLFGGTGSISYELASRGAQQLTIVENDPKMVAFLQKNLLALKIEQAQVIRMDVFKFLDSTKSTFDFIFAGPPYALREIDDIPKLVIEKKLLNPGAWFVLEHTPRNRYETYEKYAFQKNYGTTIFSFFINE